MPPAFMFEEDQHGPRTTGGSPPGPNTPSPISSRFDQFEKRQNEIWRLTFFLLFVLGLAFAWMSWGTIRSLAHHYEALPIGLVVLIVLFGLYMWKKTQEISELRGLMRGLEQHEAAPPSDRQLDQLFEIISRSQQGFRDLIDSFDDILLAVSLDGQVRSVNRSFSDLVDTPFAQLIGRPISEFVQEGTGEGDALLKLAMPRFMERRHWTGVVEAKLKNQSSPFFFDCVAHAMMRDDKIHGITVLARDVLPFAETKPVSRNSSNRFKKASTSALPKEPWWMPIPLSCACSVMTPRKNCSRDGFPKSSLTGRSASSSRISWRASRKFKAAR